MHCILLLPLALSGCLPLLLSSARTLPPGELQLSVAGLARTSGLPGEFTRAGPAAGVVELRGGLPGGRTDAGFTVHVPWHLAWDLKVQALRETAAWPSVAVRVDLGVLQPSFGAELIASRTTGAVTLITSVSAGRRSERVWRSGAGPYSMESESLVTDAWAMGLGLERRLSPIHEVFLGVSTRDAAVRHEAPQEGPGFGVTEGRSWEASGGLRIRWTMARPPRPTGALTALRGVVMTEPANDRFEVGQPGLYRAVVLVDAYTRFESGGKPASRAELKEGRAVLIQGLALPRPSTFLARTIELQ